MNHDAARSARFRIVFLTILLGAVWIYMHPYRGIWHDGRLYLGQALFHMAPDLYRGDLFFKYGSQDQFTLFSPLYAWGIKQLGLGAAPMVLVLIGQCLFVMALLLCCTTLFGIEIGFWSACAVAIVSRYYGGLELISYSETFLTARNFAEPLCLLAVWLMLMRRAGWALFTLGAAALLHPLTTLPCLLLWWLHLIAQDKRWLWLALGAVPLLILSALGVAPFDKLLQTYDAAWWKQVMEDNRFVAPAHWYLKNWSAFGFDLALIWFGSRFLDTRQRQFMRMVLLTGVIGVTVAVVATSLLQNVLLTGIQLWRAHWILHLFAVSTIPFIAFRLWPMAGAARIAAALIVVAGYLHTYPASFAVVLLAAYLYRHHKSGALLSRALFRILWGAIGLIVMLKVSVDVMVVLRPDPLMPELDSLRQKAMRVVLALPLVWMAAFWLGWLASGPKYRKLAFAGGLLCLVLSLSVWDQRTPWRRYLEQDHVEAHPFSRYLKSNAEVFWYGEVLAPWLLLKTPSYFENAQAGGLLFNRGTAIAFNERQEALKALRFQIDICLISDFLNNGNGHECWPSTEAVKEACTVSPTLEAMILPWKIDGLERKEWSIALQGNQRETSYYLYPCQAFRS